MHPARKKSLERQEKILLSLKKLDYLTRGQIQALHKLGSVRNTNRVLKDMEQYLSSFYEGQKVYYLNKKGREQVDARVVRTKITDASHYITRNDLFIRLDQPDDWRNEVKLTSGEGKNLIAVIPDARFKKDGTYFIVEIDRQQKMAKNKIKIDKYRRLIERNVFKSEVGMVWVTTSTYRQKRLQELCEGINSMVFLDTDIK